MKTTRFFLFKLYFAKLYLHLIFLILEFVQLVLEDDEYLLSLGGYYDKSRGAIRYIDIVNTNKSDSPDYELHYGEKFTLGESGHKIVGFYGQASDVLHSIGVYVVPITSVE